MHSIKADPIRQRLLMSVSGRPTNDEIEKLTAETMAEVGKLRPGYVVAIDLRGMAVLDQESAIGIARVQKVMISGSPSKVGTLVDNQILMLQLSRQGKAADSNRLTERFMDEPAWHQFLGF